MKVFFNTSNASKVSLANERLNRYGITVEQVKVEVLEPQDMDVEVVALQKAKQLEGVLNGPFILEDSGLYIDGLNGFPGALMKPVLDTIGASILVEMLNGKSSRSARVKGVLVYSDPEKKLTKSFVGLYEGRIADRERGSQTRGWKVATIFIPKSSEKTLAEMDDVEWSKFLDDFRKGDHYEQFGRWISQRLNHQ